MGEGTWREYREGEMGLRKKERDSMTGIGSERCFYHQSVTHTHTCIHIKFLDKESACARLYTVRPVQPLQSSIAGFSRFAGDKRQCG